MEAQIHSSEPDRTLEERVRLASAVLFLLNASMACQLTLGGGIEVFGREVGDLVTFPLIVAGIALALKLCGWARSFALGHFLVFIYTFGLFVTLIPYFGLHWYERMVWLRGLWHPVR